MIHYINSGISYIDIWKMYLFDTVPETLRNCQILVFPSYILGPIFQKPGVKIINYCPGSKIGSNMIFIKMNSSQVGCL